MRRWIPSVAERALFLAVMGGFSLLTCGCGENQLGKRLADRLPQVSGSEPAVTATVDAASWKRYCSIYLLNTTTEEKRDKTKTENGEKKAEPVSRSRLPDMVSKYKRLHDEIPREVVKAMSEHNVRNYSVHIGMASGDYYAVRYFEYAGSNPDVDLPLLARDPAYQQWEEACQACQVMLLPISGQPLGPFMEEVFHNELLPAGK